MEKRQFEVFDGLAYRKGAKDTAAAIILDVLLKNPNDRVRLSRLQSQILLVAGILVDTSYFDEAVNGLLEEDKIKVRFVYRDGLFDALIAAKAQETVRKGE